MQYRVGFVRDWSEMAGNVLEAGAPFPSFTNGDWINVNGTCAQIFGIAYTFTQDANGTQWANLVVIVNPTVIAPLFHLP